MSPEEVSKSAWAPGDPKAITLSPAAAQLFPLKPKSYQVVSQLSAKGKYTLSVDGELIATGSFDKALPLTLAATFKGKDLPLRWKSGYAAVMVGPGNHGTSSGLRDVTFQASAPEPVR